MNKKDFNEKIESLRFCINDSHGAVGAKELKVSIKHIQFRGEELMAALDGKLNHHAKTLTSEAESLLDRSTRYIGEMHKRINALEAK